MKGPEIPMVDDDKEDVSAYVKDALLVQNGRNNDNFELPELDRQTQETADAAKVALLAKGDALARKAEEESRKSDEARLEELTFTLNTSDSDENKTADSSVEKPSSPEQPKTVEVAQENKREDAEDLALATGAKLQENNPEQAA